MRDDSHRQPHAADGCPRIWQHVVDVELGENPSAEADSPGDEEHEEFRPAPLGLDDDGAVIKFLSDTHWQSPEVTAGRSTSWPAALGEGIAEVGVGMAGVGTADGWGV